MEKWTIRADPTPHDPRRHLLLIKGTILDINAIVKKFGAMCGRPIRARGDEDYSYEVALHAPSPASLEKLGAALLEMAPAAPGALLSAPAEPAQRTEPSPAPRTEGRPAETPSRAERGPEDPLRGLWRKLDPRNTMDAFMIGAHNRLAHAAARSALSEPGGRNSPLIFHGAPGVGKSHLANALGLEFSRVVGMESTGLTEGFRLRRSVESALEEAVFSVLEEAMDAIRVLIVDDIHLLAVDDIVRGPLAKIFARLFARNAQVVFTSTYPPRALAALWDSLKIPPAGRAVNISVPPPGDLREIVKDYLDRNGAPLAPQQLGTFLKILQGRYRDMFLWARRLVHLRRRESFRREPDIERVLKALFESGAPPDQSALPGPAELSAAQASEIPRPRGAGVATALVLPQGQENLAPWVASQFFKAGAALGLPPEHRFLPAETYDAEEPLGVAFRIGELCGNSGAGAALVLGFPVGSKFMNAEGEFSHAVRHVLENAGVRPAYLPQRGLGPGGPFRRAQLDLLGDIGE